MLEQLHYFVLNYVDIITRDTLALWLTYCTSNSAHNNRVDTIYGLPGCSIWVWNHTAVIPTSITISYIFYLSNADIGYHWNLSELNSNGGVPTVFNLKQTYLLLRIRYIYLLFYITSLLIHIYISVFLIIIILFSFFSFSPPLLLPSSCRALLVKWSGKIICIEKKEKKKKSRILQHSALSGIHNTFFSLPFLQ